MKGSNPLYRSSLYHYKLVYDDLKDKPYKCLDYGTGNAEFIGNLSESKSKFECHAFDVDIENINKAKKKYSRVKFRHVKVDGKFPYKSNYFDVVFMFHVLEHVGSEKEAIRNIHRILKPGGRLYLASPYKGLFAWADTANLRFRFPKFHKIFMDFVLGETEYNKRFIEHKNEGLYGDCTATRNWHKHYKEEDVRLLVNSKFEIHKFRKFSIFHPFLLVLNNVWDYIFHKESAVIKQIIYLDNLLKVGDLSYNFLVVAKKK